MVTLNQDPQSDDDDIYTNEEIDDMQTALHGFIMDELENEIQDANNNPYRWIYEVVMYSSSPSTIPSTVRFYTNPVDCHSYFGENVMISYTRVEKTSPIFATAFHNSNVNRIRLEHDIPIEAMIYPCSEINRSLGDCEQ